MEKKILLEEELKKFKKLSGVLNEAAGPSAWLSEFLSKVTKKALPAEIISDFESLAAANKIKINPTTKMLEVIDWRSLSTEEIKILFKWNGMYEAFTNVVKANNIPLDDASLAVYRGDFKKIATAYTSSGQNLGQAFKAGTKATGAPTLFMRRALRLVTPGVVKKYFPEYFQKLTPEEVKKMHAWFWLGVGDYKSVVDTFKRYGFPNAVANLTGQVYKKWLFWTIVFTSSNFLIGLFKDLGEDDVVYDSDVEAIYDRFLNSLDVAGLHWVFPSVWVYKSVISPLLKGGAAGRKKSELISILDNIKTKSQREKDAIERLKGSVKDSTNTSGGSGTANFDKY